MTRPWTVLLCTMLMAACTTNSPHRTNSFDSSAPMNPQTVAEAEKDCRWDGSTLSGENRYQSRLSCTTHSVEATEKYKLFFVEFDEQGRMYDDNQFSQLFRYLENRVNCGSDLSIVVFVHGWRHNAKADDENVTLAREVLAFTHDGEQTGSHPNLFRMDSAEQGKRNKTRCKSEPSVPGPREVVGVYVGWRGKSLDGGKGLLSNWELPSVFDRKNTAENVAIGSVRELFSRLRVFQFRQNIYENTCKEGAGPYQCKRVRMLIVGHSFGGLLVFNAVSASIMDSLSIGADVDPSLDNCVEGPTPADAAQAHAPVLAAELRRNDAHEESAMVHSFADLIVLVNPAIEGARFEPLQQALQRRIRDKGGFCPNQKPVLIVVTADNDVATHYLFRGVRFFSTLFESTSPVGLGGPNPQQLMTIRDQEEREASRNAMGHVERFQTHAMVGVEALMRGDDGGKVPTDYGARHKQYCAGGTESDPLEAALRECRCGESRWTNYIKWSKATPASANCPSYVEEVNAARFMTRKDIDAGSGGSASGTLYEHGQWLQAFCGAPVLAHLPDHVARSSDGAEIKSDWGLTTRAPNTPVWMIKSYDPAIIDNHSHISKFPFEIFVRQIYHNISIRKFDRPAFEELESVASRGFNAECKGESPNGPQ